MNEKTVEVGALHCPFCGFTDLRIITYESVYSVVCVSCGAAGPTDKDITEAVAKWGKREDEKDNSG